MKIKLNKSTITMDQADEAREMAKNEAEWIDAETLRMFAALNVRAYHDDENAVITKVIKLPELTVTVNHYRLSIWADDMIVEVWANQKKRIDVVSFDVLDASRNEKCAFIVSYVEADNGTV